jgi:hypothetical protein
MPPKKRPRTDKRDPDLYFPDGSVVLSATAKDPTESQNLVYFRVHKSVLAKHSLVFEDMLTIPTPADQELYDGVPLVHLHDDAGEVKEFIGMLYNPL